MVSQSNLPNEPSVDPLATRIMEFRQEARNARLDRINKSAENRRVLRGEISSDKITGQSNQTLPKLSVAMMALTAVVKTGLTGTDDWFSVNTSLRAPIQGHNIRRLLKCFLENLATPVAHSAAPRNLVTLITEAVKSACTDSLMIYEGSWTGIE